MPDILKKEPCERLYPSHEKRSYYILSLLQERELLRAKVQIESTQLEDFYSPAASTMAAALIEEVLTSFEEFE